MSYRSPNPMRLRPKSHKQHSLFTPAEMPVHTLRCENCLGLYRVDRGCTWCKSGGHARAEAQRFANAWLVAQFPWAARLMPKASYL